MALKGIIKKRYKKYPGITVECKSGRFMAFYDHRSDIIADGDNEVEAKKNLKKMYEIVMAYEKKEEEEKKDEQELPANFKTKRFTEKLPLK
jgi:uncharacterized protein YcnI